MKLTKGLLAVAIAATIGFTSCGPKMQTSKQKLTNLSRPMQT